MKSPSIVDGVVMCEVVCCSRCCLLQSIPFYPYILSLILFKFSSAYMKKCFLMRFLLKKRRFLIYFSSGQREIREQWHAKIWIVEVSQLCLLQVISLWNDKMIVVMNCNRRTKCILVEHWLLRDFETRSLISSFLISSESFRFSSPWYHSTTIYDFYNSV